MQKLGRRPATGDRFLKEMLHDLDSLPEHPFPGRVREQRRSRVSIQANPVYWRLPPIAAAA